MLGSPSWLWTSLVTSSMTDSVASKIAQVVVIYPILWREILARLKFICLISKDTKHLSSFLPLCWFNLWWNWVIVWTPFIHVPTHVAIYWSLIECFQNCCQDFQSWNCLCFCITLLTKQSCPRCRQRSCHCQIYCGQITILVQEVHHSFRWTIQYFHEYRCYSSPDWSCSLTLPK